VSFLDSDLFIIKDGTGYLLNNEYNYVQEAIIPPQFLSSAEAA